MHKRLSIMVIALMAIVAFTAVPAAAASYEASPPTVKAKPSFKHVGTPAGTGTANCLYMVGRDKGLTIYSRPTHLSTPVASIAGGQTFVATCGNVTGGRYEECGMSDQWKFVGNGYLKTKCLIRLTP